MKKIKNNEFHLRIKKQSTSDLIEKIANENSLTFNEVINLALEEGLQKLERTQFDKQRELISACSKVVREELQPLKETLAMLLTIQMIDKKMISSLYQQFDFFIQNSGNVKLPEAYKNKFDQKLPEHFDKLKASYIKKVLDNDD